MRLLRRGSRVLLALCVGFLLLELGLWALAFARSTFTGPRGAPASSAGATTWLAVGDSHTYGFNVDASAAWPARVEALLREQGVAVRIVNEAVPGQNTTTVLELLPALLAQHRPALVFVLAGLNNPFSRPEDDGAIDRALRATRTWKLWRAIAQRLEPTPMERLKKEDDNGTHAVEQPDGSTWVAARSRSGAVHAFRVGNGTLSAGEGELGRAWIVRDLERICALVRAAGAEPVLLTYAREEGELVPGVNFSIRAAASTSQAHLIDCASALEPGLRGKNPDDSFFKDLHPRRQGYEAIARLVHDELVDAGLVAAPRLGDPWAFDGARSAVAPLRWSSDTELELSGDAGLAYTVLLARARGDQPGFGDFRISLAPDDLFDASKAAPALSGDFDGAGRARVALPAALVELAGDGPLFAVLVLRTRAWSVQRISAAVERAR
jgi:lysophospholipase L1-like esterase